MKVTYNWLKDFVDINITPGALADKLTMAGLEVVSLEQRGGDYIFEIEITSNRPDWLSVIGVAREVAAITGKKLQLPKDYGRPTSHVLRPTERAVSILIENKKDCPLYTATVITRVKVAPSPDWLKQRLELLGCRPVNNVVDITNYALFETGQPMHAFDLDKLPAGGIAVRRANNGEKLTILDGQEKTLDGAVLVIAAQDKAKAVAGVMGGKDTEVNGGTKNILLEAAVFDPALIRRSRRQLGLQTESSYRFERGVDAAALDSARRRAVELILGISGGESAPVESRGAGFKKKKIVNLSMAHADKVLGVSITAAEAVKILKMLGFGAKPRAKNNFSVEIPSFRGDVNLEADLIEEIARIHGYNLIPVSLPSFRPNATAAAAADLVWMVKNTLAGQGLNEAITLSLIERGLAECFQVPAGLAVEIQNPLSREQEILRTAITPSLARCVALNLNQKQEYVNIFEVSKVFSLSADKNNPQEQLNLGIALCGERSMFLEGGLVKDKAGLPHLKGLLERLFRKLGVKVYDFRMLGSQEAGVYIGEDKVGFITGLGKKALDYLDIKNKDVFVAEVCLDKILSAAALKIKFRPLSLYPGIKRDISFLIRQGITAKDVLGAVRLKAGPLLEDVRIADYYTGKQVPVGQRSLTVSCFYRSPERTLTDNEVNPLQDAVCALLKERFGAKLR
ncbi:MAG: phenylalanine--tRNA ligase subunit beta [Candidatus Omnitrophota bacterium]|nr:phenylalanine--tRNA ligase subunit beta [Candidatus Omnitrophota bacterium]